MTNRVPTIVWHPILSLYLGMFYKLVNKFFDVMEILFRLLLNLFRHISNLRSVTMPGIASSREMRYLARNNLQNHRDLIYRTSLIFYSVDFDSTATSRLTFDTRPWSTFPGPTSVNSVTPSAIIFSAICVQRTGAVSCAIRFFLMVSASV